MSTYCVTKVEASKLLGVSVRMVDKYLHSGELTVDHMEKNKVKASHKADEERIKSLEAKILKGGSDEERAVKAMAEVKEYLEIVAGSRVKNTRVY